MTDNVCTYIHTYVQEFLLQQERIVKNNISTYDHTAFALVMPYCKVLDFASMQEPASHIHCL